MSDYLRPRPPRLSVIGNWIAESIAEHILLRVYFVVFGVLTALFGLIAPRKIEAWLHAIKLPTPTELL
jgi:hypothetical protein